MQFCVISLSKIARAFPRPNLRVITISTQLLGESFVNQVRSSMRLFEVPRKPHVTLMDGLIRHVTRILAMELIKRKLVLP